jgi:hypothetical protein
VLLYGQQDIWSVTCCSWVELSPSNSPARLFKACASRLSWLCWQSSICRQGIRAVVVMFSWDHRILRNSLGVSEGQFECLTLPW